jgi:uncharacterized protein YebE (UPF0316 family)
MRVEITFPPPKLRFIGYGVARWISTLREGRRINSANSQKEPRQNQREKTNAVELLHERNLQSISLINRLVIFNLFSISTADRRTPVASTYLQQYIRR